MYRCNYIIVIRNAKSQPMTRVSKWKVYAHEYTEQWPEDYSVVSENLENSHLIILDLQNLWKMGNFLNVGKTRIEEFLHNFDYVTLYPSVTSPAHLFAKLHFILRIKTRSSSISPLEFAGGKVKPARSAGLCGRFRTDNISAWSFW